MQQNMLFSKVFLLLMAFLYFRSGYALLSMPGFSKKLYVVLRYPVTGGLTNQHYSQISGFTVALAFGADSILMPSPLKRGEFHVDPAAQKFEPSPFEDIYDMEHIKEWLAGKDVELVPGALRPLTEMLHTPALPEGAVKVQDILMPDIYTKERNLQELVTEMRALLTRHVKGNKEELEQVYDPARKAVPVYLTFPLPLLMGIDYAGVTLAVEVAENLRFPDSMKAVARKLTRLMEEETGYPFFNGLHMRIETDASGWFGMFGGEDGVWKAYEKGAKRLRFGTLPVYVACGLWSKYNVNKSAEAEQRLTGFLKQWSPQYFYKEKLLGHEFDEYTSEQLALLDLLVLMRGRRFLGFYHSTYSVLIQEYRAIFGVPRVNGYLIGQPGETFREAYTGHSGTVLDVCMYTC